MGGMETQLLPTPATSTTRILNPLSVGLNGILLRGEQYMPLPATPRITVYNPRVLR